MNRKAIHFYASIQADEAAPARQKGNACFYLYAYDTEGVKCKLRGAVITAGMMRSFGLRWGGFPFSTVPFSTVDLRLPFLPFSTVDLRLPFVTFLGDEVREMLLLGTPRRHD